MTLQMGLTLSALLFVGSHFLLSHPLRAQTQGSIAGERSEFLAAFIIVDQRTKGGLERRFVGRRHQQRRAFPQFLQAGHVA